MKIYIGAENIISPIGNTAEENFVAACDQQSGIRKIKVEGMDKGEIFLSKFSNTLETHSFESLIRKCLVGMLADLNETILDSAKTILIISTTKGDLLNELSDPMGKSISNLKHSLSLKHCPIVVSNACASGVIAINTGAQLIRAGMYENAIVVGCDLISDFIVRGFQSLFAISEKPCTPFDKERSGITLGEGCAGLVLSLKKNIFRKTPMHYVNGSSSNDANHISGPSRTGEGLFRTVKKTLALAQMSEQDIDFISAHGTATGFNDDMESIAFERLKMNAIPLNSFKAYFGHTLGAAGVMETALCIQSMRNNTLIKSLGFTNLGTTEKMNVLSENRNVEIETVLKTSSGFGGCNGSLILKKG